MSTLKVIEDHLDNCDPEAAVSAIDAYQAPDADIAHALHKIKDELTYGSVETARALLELLMDKQP